MRADRQHFFCLTVGCLLSLFARTGLGDTRPNILWITLEDICPDLGCYGVDYADTPNVDALAEAGIIYTRAWSNAGVCAPARATLITGMYPPGTGAQNMRSQVLLPSFIRAFPEHLRKAGYYTSNHSKTDYNWIAPPETWTTNSRDWANDGWRKRNEGQPFFTVINITDTHSSQLYWRGARNYERRIRELGRGRLHDPVGAPVPPYYPDLPEVRADLARYHDNITYADGIVGRILDQLRADKLQDDTIVFFFSDHGRGMPRTKGWPFYSSLHVPLIVRFPDKHQQFAPGSPGSSEERIVSFVDFAPTVLSLAGVAPPNTMDGTAFLGQFAGEPRKFAYAYRDRLDERIDLIRSVWDGRYHYIRNYFPHLPWFHQQTRDYPHTQDTYVLWHKLAAEEKLSPPQAIYMAHRRPMEMLFDTQADPHELKNLAAHPDQRARLREFRAALHEWQDEIIDLGFMPESYWFEQFEGQADMTPRHTLVRSRPEMYPLSRLREQADQLLEQSHDARLSDWSSDNLPTRFWAGMRILANQMDTPEIRQTMSSSLRDPSPTIRILAAQILATHDADHKQALDALLHALEHPQPFVALRAANALDHLGDNARGAVPGIRTFLMGRAASDQRNQALGVNYPEWVLRRTIARLERTN